MFKKLAQQLKTQFSDLPQSPTTSPIKSDVKDPFLKNMSKHALELYERKTDINNFKKLVLSDPDNLSHNELVDKLYESRRSVNPLTDDALWQLSENQRFLDDLGL